MERVTCISRQGDIDYMQNKTVSAKKECGRTKSTAAEENTLGHKLQPTNIISYNISRLRSRIFEILEQIYIYIYIYIYILHIHIYIRGLKH